MRKTGIFAIAFIVSLMMIIPAVSVNTDAVDSWDNNSSAYSIDGKNVSNGLYQLLTSDNQNHVGLYVIDKTGFNFLANENNSSLGVVAELDNIHMSDGIIKAIDNKYETVTEQYTVVRADLNIVVNIDSDDGLGSLTNKLYTNEDRGFSELRTYLGLGGVNTFTVGDYYSLECHIESYICEVTTNYYKETVLGDYYISKTVVETTEVLHVTKGTFGYTPTLTKETVSVPCTIDLSGTTRTITDYSYGEETPVSGTEGVAKIYTTSVNDGTATYSFSGSNHVAIMTNPQSYKSVAATCEAYTYNSITSYIAKSGPKDLYPDTENPSVFIDSIKDVVIHYTVPDVENDLNAIQKEFGIIKEPNDNSYIKTIVYIVVAILVVIALIVVYMKFIRNRR